MQTSEGKMSLARRFNLQVTMNPEKTRAEVILPGLSYDDFDRTGNVSIWKMSKLFESARLLVLLSGNYLDFHKLMANDGTMFIRSGHYIISDVLYQSAAIIWPLKACTSLMFIGRTSLNLIIELREQSTNQHVGSLEFQYVYVNRTNRKSQAFPDWFIQKYKPLTALQTRPDTMLPLSQPSKTFAYDVTVQYSDTDRNGHTNQSSYLKYGMDAATNASLGGGFCNFKQDMCMYHIQGFQALYTGESLVKDHLVIHTWEDEARQDLLFFQIHKNGQAIFHCKVTLCNPATAKL